MTFSSPFSALQRTDSRKRKPQLAPPWVQATKGMKSLTLAFYFLEQFRLIPTGILLPSWFFYCDAQKCHKIFPHSAFGRRCSKGLTNNGMQQLVSSRVRRSTSAYESVYTRGFSCFLCWGGHHLRSPLKPPLGEKKKKKN